MTNKRKICLGFAHPVEPQNRNDATGRPASRSPLRARRTARAMDLMARCCPLTREASEDSSVRSVEDSVDVSLPMGMFVHWEMISDMSRSVTSGGGLGVIMERNECSICTAAPASSSKSIA